MRATRRRCAAARTGQCDGASRLGRIYVAEDDDDLQLVLLADQFGQRIAAPFLQLAGHEGSEIAGPAFDPDGSRLYFSSQRGIEKKTGMMFEAHGPVPS